MVATPEKVLNSSRSKDNSIDMKLSQRAEGLLYIRILNQGKAQPEAGEKVSRISV
jgi:hypothetical protein